MNLHLNLGAFEDLIILTSRYKNIPEDAVRKDYFITILLKNLSASDYKSSVVFKGGTSLSKCYPNSINRFSEDIDLTYIPLTSDMSAKAISRELKKIEQLIVGEAYHKK